MTGRDRRDWLDAEPELTKIIQSSAQDDPSPLLVARLETAVLLARSQASGASAPPSAGLKQVAATTILISVGAALRLLHPVAEPTRPPAMPTGKTPLEAQDSVVAPMEPAPLTNHRLPSHAQQSVSQRSGPFNRKLR